MITSIEIIPPFFPLVIPLAIVKDFVMGRLYAFIICRVTEIATRWGRANIARFLRIGAQWPAARGRRRGEIIARCDDGIGVDALFDPSDQRREQVKLIGCRPARTVPILVNLSA